MAEQYPQDAVVGDDGDGSTEVRIDNRAQCRDNAGSYFLQGFSTGDAAAMRKISP